jgi:hypothetical protein
MIYTSGIILNPDIEETLEQLQDNKLAVVCNKLDLKPTDKYVIHLLPKRSELNKHLIDFLILVVVGELSSLTLQRTLDAMPLALLLLRINTNSVLSVLPRTE